MIPNQVGSRMQAARTHSALNCIVERGLQISGYKTPSLVCDGHVETHPRRPHGCGPANACYVWFAIYAKLS